jgi:hypothetical protein
MTESTRSRRLRRAAMALTAAGALASATVFAVGATGSIAGATNTKHNAVGTINGSPAVENSVRVSFKCDDSSGQWSFKISNVQVINANHTTPWTTFGVTFSYGKMPNLQSHTVSLTQDLRNGLFDGTASGSDGPLDAFCVTAASLKVGDADTDGGNLFIIANIR